MISPETSVRKIFTFFDFPLKQQIPPHQFEYIYDILKQAQTCASCSQLATPPDYIPYDDTSPLVEAQLKVREAEREVIEAAMNWFNTGFVATIDAERDFLPGLLQHEGARLYHALKALERAKEEKAL